MFEWLYIHMSLGRNGGFLFGFTTAVTLIFVLVGFPTVSWCKECLRVSESSRREGRRKRKHAQGIQKRGEAPFSGVVQFACLFRLLFASTACAGWMTVWFALLSAYYHFGAQGMFVVFKGAVNVFVRKVYAFAMQRLQHLVMGWPKGGFRKTVGAQAILVTYQQGHVVGTHNGA